MKDVLIIGSSSSGKSTLSRRLSEITDIPAYHLDKLYWKLEWTPLSEDEFDNSLDEILHKDKWIIDGNYSRTLDLRLKYADTIIYLNMPRILCIYRIIKRRFMYRGKTRLDMGEGCLEKLDFKFIKWVWSFNKNKRPKLLKKLNELSHEKNVLIFNSSSELENAVAVMR